MRLFIRGPLVESRGRWKLRASGKEALEVKSWDDDGGKEAKNGNKYHGVRKVRRYKMSFLSLSLSLSLSLLLQGRSMTLNDYKIETLQRGHDTQEAVKSYNANENALVAVKVIGFLFLPFLLTNLPIFFLPLLGNSFLKICLRILL